MKLIYIGRHFYDRSNTRMSCLYTENGLRSDWCKVENALEDGENVEIRQPKPAEIAKYTKMLFDILEK